MKQLKPFENKLFETFRISGAKFFLLNYNFLYKIHKFTKNGENVQEKFEIASKYAIRFSILISEFLIFDMISVNGNSHV